MADNRKYYYLKLKESCFEEDTVVLLESMQDGMLCSNILLKMYLKSLKNEGKLQLAENIPYTAPTIATITRQQVGTVERALQICPPEIEKEIDIESETKRGRAKERTDRPRSFWQIQKRLSVRKRACGAARGTSRQMGVLH